METSLKNIKTIKVNDFEIAKANDMNDGFKSILEHLEVYTNHVISGHHATIRTFKEAMKPVINTDKMPIDKMPIAREKYPQDFVIGGGLEVVDASSDFNLRLLPIVAYNKYSGLFISNGKNEEGKDISIDLDKIGEIRGKAVVKYENDEEIIVEEERVLPGISSASFYIYGEQNGSIGQYDDKAFRIVSIYLGDTLEQRHLDNNTFSNKRDPKWLSYDNEWRASADGTIKEFPKQQMPIVKLYGLAGELNYDILKVKAPDTPIDDLWKRRIKIAEVLTSYSRKRSEDDHYFVLNPINKKDIHFVTATHYWENARYGKNYDIEFYAKVCEENFKECKKATWRYGEPKCPFAGQDLTFRFSADLETQKKEVKQKEKNKETWDDWEEAKAFEAQRYNFRWTNEHTRTYSLTSLAEFNEAFRNIHKNDGTLKYEVVNRQNIFLNNGDTTDFDRILKHQLRGEHIYIKRKSLEGKEWGIKLQYDNEFINNILIKETDHIDIGFEKVGLALRIAYSDIDKEQKRIVELSGELEEEKNKRYEQDKVIYDKFVEHTNKLNAHGATREAEKGRIALRDEYGCFKVTVPEKVLKKGISIDTEDMYLPPSPEYVINIGYLNDRLLAFKKELTLEMLTTKLVSCQKEFEDWVNYAGSGTGYKIVYLQGRFTWNGGDIDLSKIGTEQIIGIKDRDGNYPEININKNKISKNKAGICCSSSQSKISNVVAYISGYAEDGIIGFSNCICVECDVFVTGEDGYRHKKGFDIKIDEYHRDGISATGYLSCECTKCKATVKGGNGCKGYSYDFDGGGYGGNAVCFKNSRVDGCEGKATGGDGGVGRYGSATLARGERGGNGGNGGVAKVFDNCELKSDNNVEEAIGGSGGDGGNGGNAGVGFKSGDGGHGGNGGDVYVYKDGNSVAGKGGKGAKHGLSGKGYEGEWGQDGYDGKLKIIN